MDRELAARIGRETVRILRECGFEPNLRHSIAYAVWIASVSCTSLST
jgi:hypothetical protein